MNRSGATVAAPVVVVQGAVLEGIPTIVPFGLPMFPIAEQVGADEMHDAMVVTVVVRAMGLGPFAPSCGVGYYAASAISRIHPDAGSGSIAVLLVATGFP